MKTYVIRAVVTLTVTAPTEDEARTTAVGYIRFGGVGENPDDGGTPGVEITDATECQGPM